MAKAKVLSDKDLAKLLKHVATRRHAARNRCILMLTYLAALRIGEVAQLKLSNVLNADGTLKDEIRFAAEQVKEGRDSSVPIAEKLAMELKTYLATVDCSDLSKPLFATQQRREGFTANTLTTTINSIYKEAGIAGGSSHSGRRTLITKLADRGVGVRQLQAIARHSSISTTQGYIECNEDQLRRAMKLL